MSRIIIPQLNCCWLVGILFLSVVVVATATVTATATATSTTSKADQQQHQQQLRSSSSSSQSSQQEQERNLIIGGYEVSSKERFPYYVALLDANNEIQCGGTLIAPDIVLTAAHCKNSNLKYALVGKYTNLMDDGHEKIEIMNPHTDLSGSEDGSTTSITSTTLETSGKAKLDNSGFIHPDHDHTKRTYDIMLMKLSRAATNVSSDQLMKINMNPSIPLKEKEGANEITVIGMGNTDVRGLTPKPDTLQQVHLNYLPYEQCIDSEGYNLDYKFELLPHMICTQGTGIYGNRGQCYGDSGGPYIVLGTTPEEDVQVGVVSWAVNCASSQFPMVGSRTSASVDFIRDVTCAVSVDPPAYLCGTTVDVTSSNNNNTVQTRIDVQNGVSISVRIYSDPYGHELSWKITDQLDTSTIYAEAPYGTIIGDHMFQTVSLPAGSDLRFEINDAADDGIFGNPDAVLYEIVLVDQGDELVLVEGNGQFTTSREENFHIPLSSEYQSIFASQYSSFKQGQALDRIGSGGPTVPLFIYIKFDDYHEDASWKVTSADGVTVFASKGPNEYRYGNEITEQVNLPPGEYMFTIKDRRGTDDLRAFQSYKISYQDRDSLYNSSGSKDKIIYDSTSLNFIGESESHTFVIEPIAAISSQPEIVIEDAQSLELVAADGGLRTCALSADGHYCVSGETCCSGMCNGSKCKSSTNNTSSRYSGRNSNRISRMGNGSVGGSARLGGGRQ